MNNESLIGNRIRAARKAAGYATAKQFIDKHDVPASTYSQHESGARTANGETLEKYSKLFGVDINWLKTGDGKPYNSRNVDKNTIIESEMLHSDLLNEKPSPLNQTLLTEILKQLLQVISQSKKPLSEEKLAELISNIYSDISTMDTSKESQIKMVKIAVDTLKHII